MVLGEKIKVKGVRRKGVVGGDKGLVSRKGVIKG